MRIRFDEIRRTRKRSGPCATCGKPTTQTLAVSQTVNPFNLDASTKKTEDGRADSKGTLRGAPADE